MEDFSSWKSAHLAWIFRTKTFVPRYPTDYRQDISYYEVMKQLYSNPNVTEQYAKNFFVSDKKWFNLSMNMMNDINKEVAKLTPSVNNVWFVTIGFNHQEWSVSKCCKVIENILNFDWILHAKANFELYRENGEHPHVHIYLETELPKSKVLEKLFRPQYVKKVVLSKNFIDIKKAEHYHLKYIELDKQENKQELIEKDKLWRSKNNIPDYEKNWKSTN
nr:rep protein [Cressdnaviricota sp.]